jgi:hypothetical protein
MVARKNERRMRRASRMEKGVVRSSANPAEYFFAGAAVSARHPSETHDADVAVGGAVLKTKGRGDTGPLGALQGRVAADTESTGRVVFPKIDQGQMKLTGSDVGLDVLSQSTVGLVDDAMQEGMMSMTTPVDLTVAVDGAVDATMTRTQTTLAKTIASEDVFSLEDVSGAEVVALDEGVVLLVMTERAGGSWPLFFLSKRLRGVGPGVADRSIPG